MKKNWKSRTRESLTALNSSIEKFRASIAGDLIEAFKTIEGANDALKTIVANESFKKAVFKRSRNKNTTVVLKMSYMEFDFFCDAIEQFYVQMGKDFRAEVSKP